MTIEIHIITYIYSLFCCCFFGYSMGKRIVLWVGKRKAEKAYKEHIERLRHISIPVLGVDILCEVDKSEESE